ncbi:eukaryotic aspartyl protease family protein [Tasmannia lanceolata]|uniref:eukaryotic aspartyl protease family protein n=1 Tax=Tasmannia lanceolata TaxID=3420 RepID=UPI004063E5BA
MASCYDFLLFFISLSLAFSLTFQNSHGRTFSFDLHHRFSDPVKKWVSEKSGTGFQWPEKGSIDYYSALADQDRVIRGRGLASDEQMLTFSDGNITCKIPSLGFLHYTFVSLGTPSVSFLVALDTGSDLFWVPCDCIRCASTSSARYGFDLELSIYSPNSSSTSKTVPCNSSLCEARSECSEIAGNCPYKVAYVSTDTSSSGILMEDVMYLTTEDTLHDVVKAQIIFGCGKVQTGSFLDGAAPNGLFGLGMEKMSVPSILSSAGLTANSFSMCFGRDGIGRIIFGDKGSPDQGETPFNLKPRYPTYNVSVTGIRVGTNIINTNFSAIIDSGTSFTYLADPAYTHISESFHSLVADKQRSPDPRIPFDYCYFMSPNQNSTVIPSISLTMKGGSQFSVFDPIIVMSIEAEFVYCLAVVKSHNLNIIGQNFLTGNRIVFDREKSILGWKKFDCYDMEDTHTVPMNQQNFTTEPPSPAIGPNSYTPEATRQTRNGSQVSVLTPSFSHSPHLIPCFIYILFFLFVLLSVIL